jgi:hypothetical protein
MSYICWKCNKPIVYLADGRGVERIYNGITIPLHKRCAEQFDIHPDKERLFPTREDILDYDWGE